MNPVPNSRNVHRRQRVQEAGCQTAKAAIAEAHIGFFIRDRFQILTEFGEGGGGYILELEVNQII